MNIVIATLMREQGTTGVQSHFNSLREGLVARGDRVTLVNSFSLPSWLYRPVFAIRPLLLVRWFKPASVFWYRYWHYQFLRFALIRLLKQESVDIIDAQCPLSARAAMAARALSGSHCKVVLTCHFNVSQADEFADRGELRRGGRYFKHIYRFESALLAQVDSLVFVSRFSQQAIAEAHGLSLSHGEVIHNGVRSATIAPVARRSLGVPDKAFMMISVGTLEPRKNQRCLVAAVIHLLQTHADYHLILVGDGPDRGVIELLVERANLEGQVHLLGFRDDVPGLLAASDLYCHPARMESFGIAVVEAMAAGLPVVAAPVGGIPEFVEHGERGMLIDCDSSPSNYGEQLGRLAQDVELRSALGSRGREYYRQQLTVPAMCDAYRQHFSALTGQAGV